MSIDIEFIYKLDGENIDKTGVNIRDLAPILLSLADLIEEGNKTVYPNGSDIAVNVKPFGKGSFVVDISVFSKIWEGLTNLINQHTIQDIKTLLEWLGLLGGGGVGVITLIKFLKGKPKEVKKINANEITYINEKGNSLTVNVNVDKLYNNGSIHNYIKQSIVDPFENKEIDKIETFLKLKESETKMKIDKADIPAIKEGLVEGATTSHSDDETDNQPIVMYLHPKKIDLEGDGRSWRFRKAGAGNEIVHATIKDEVFLKKQISLSKDDLLKVKYLTKQRIVNGRISSTNEIIEILEYTPGMKQDKLF